MWGWLGTAAWVASALLFLWMVWDFLRVNKDFGEDVLLSSREGVDELFADASKPKGN
jgi:hypothetical protein